jgi:hypothetical protein
VQVENCKSYCDFDSDITPVKIVAGLGVYTQYSIADADIGFARVLFVMLFAGTARSDARITTSALSDTGNAAPRSTSLRDRLEHRSVYPYLSRDQCGLERPTGYSSASAFAETREVRLRAAVLSLVAHSEQRSGGAGPGLRAVRKSLPLAR